MNLTEFFNSLPQIDKPYNKYASYSLAFGNPYRMITCYEAYIYDKFDPYIRQFIIDNGKCIVMPNYFNNEVISLVFRSCCKKEFRYHIEYKNIPYGAGVNDKPFYKPWIIVESALDSDFLRNFYPYVISTNTAAVSSNTMKFLIGTCSTVYCGFDNDETGNKAFYIIRKKYANNDFHIKRFLPLQNFDGTPQKDFGDILELLHKNNIEDYTYYVELLKNLITNINTF